MYQSSDGLGLVHGLELVKKFGYCIVTTCFDFDTQISANWGLVLTPHIILICTIPSLLGLVHELELARAWILT